MTGCAATAMAQIMRYHQEPTSYQWGNMLNDYRDFAGTPTQLQIDAVADLMLDVGTEIDMDWGCSSSGPSGDWQDAIPDALTGAFNFTSYSNLTNYSPSSSQTVKANIDQNNPLLFYGVDNGSAHLWVCDGYSRRNICTWDEQTQQVFSVTYLFYHMNWGWNGDTNGWFGYTTWGGNFSSNQQYYHNINE